MSTTHDYHPGLPGYHPDQILHDGCAECERRGANVETAIGSMDHKRFEKAWLRTADQRASTPPSGDRGGPRSVAESKVLDAIWAIQVHLENRGIPIGDLPGEDVETRLARLYPDSTIIHDLSQ
jgi:hypothetical protein